MATILDALRQQQPQAAQLAGQAGTGTTSRLQSILAQTSGRAATQAPGAAPVQNFGERAGVSGVQQQAAGAAAQQAVEGAQVQTAEVGQNEAAKAAAADTTQQLSAANEKAANEASAILDKFEQGGAALQLEKNQFSAQQLGFAMRLQSQQYTAKLQQTGQLQRLKDSAAFDQATVHAVLGAQLESLGKHIDSETALAVNDAEFRQSLSDVEIQDWINSALYESKSKQSAAGFGGLASVAEGGGKLYAAKQSSDQADQQQQDDMWNTDDTGGTK